MARHLFEVEVTIEAFAKMIKTPQDRLQAIRPVFEAFGGKAEEYYFAVGQNKVYLIGHVPDEITLEALTLAVIAGGAVTSIKTTAILTAGEGIEAMEKASDMLYKPPS